jgi:hypothetical protein
MERPVNIVCVYRERNAKWVERIDVSMHSMKTFLGHIDIFEAFLFDFLF